MITLFFAAWLYLAAHAATGSALGVAADGPQAPITTPEALK